MAKTVKSKEDIYQLGNIKLTKADNFIYEVDIYKIFKDRVETLGSQLYLSKDYLDIKKQTMSIKKRDYTLVKFVTWLSAPFEYLLNNGFKLYENNSSGGKKMSSKSKNSR